MKKIEVSQGYLVLYNKKKKYLAYKLENPLSIFREGRILLTSQARLVKISGEIKETDFFWVSQKSNLRHRTQPSLRDLNGSLIPQKSALKQVQR